MPGMSDGCRSTIRCQRAQGEDARVGLDHDARSDAMHVSRNTAVEDEMRIVYANAVLGDRFHEGVTRRPGGLP